MRGGEQLAPLLQMVRQTQTLLALTAYHWSSTTEGVEGGVGGGGEMSKYGKIWKEREQRRGREEGESNDVRLEREHIRKKMKKRGAGSK